MKKFRLSSDIIKYITIIICFMISLFIGRDGINKRDSLLLITGLFFTLVADLLLLLLSYDTLGIAVFCIVQILHSLRFNKGVNLRAFIIRRIVYLGALISMHFIINHHIREMDFLYTIAVFYATLLIGNVLRGISSYRQREFPRINAGLMAFGMILFLLCDINVALYNTINNNSIPFLLIWLFYLPSQIMLALSGWKWN